MTVQVEGGVIRLTGACMAEDAETLVSALQLSPDSQVDLGTCTHLHGALVQVLLAFRAYVRDRAEDIFLKDWILPLLTADGADSGRQVY
ncbi:MAG: hypothetical protein PW843_06440 [Azospirillaceae bacterium]|nr:hypothetical protein [Azospirillaceae bacterium]